MSKKFAEQILLLNNLNQIRDMIERNKTEIDNEFFSHLIKVKNAHVQTNNYEDTIYILRILYEAGYRANNFYFSSFSLFQVADLEIRRRDFNRAMNMIRRCIEECDKSTDMRCMEMKARALQLQGELHFRQYFNANEALRSLQSAAQIYQRLGKNEDSARVHTFIENIRESIRVQRKQESTIRRIGDILDEIVESRDTLQSLKMEIEARQRSLAEIQNQHDLVSAKVAELQQTQAALISENSAIKEQITEHRKKLDALRLRSSLLATAHETPLWVAAVRADIANGEISNLALPLLEHMRMSEPHYAAPLVAEIRARNSLSPQTLLDLSSLTGEARLFAGIANSYALESENLLAAIEVVLEAWETFLNSTSGTAH